MKKNSTSITNLSKEEKRALLAQLLKKKVNSTQPTPLTYAQKKYWLFDRKDPGNPTFNLINAYRIIGPFNTRALEQSLNELTKRHETLRTTFREVNGQPVQVIAADMKLNVSVIDLHDISTGKKEKEVRRIIEKETLFPFDLSTGPLIRITVIRTGKEEHVLTRTMHHICSDGWSLSILRKELGTLYEAFSRGKPSPLPALPVRFSSYLHWQQNWLNSEKAQTHLNYWKQKLGRQLPLLNLPAHRPRPQRQTYNGARQSMMLKKELYDSLLALSTQKRCTFFVLLLACFNLLLHIYGRQDDIIVGTPVSGRSRAELEKLIGCFADFIAIRTTIKSSTGFPGLLNQVKKECMEAFEHQNLPFQKLLEELELPGTPGRPPVFRVILNMLNYEDMQPDFPGAAVSRIEVDKQRVDVDLKVLLMKKTDGLSIILYYNTDLFTSTAMAGFLANFHHLLESIAANPEQKLSTIKSLIEVK